MTYKRTHPWLTFTLDLRNLPYLTWATLGECQSKCEHIGRAPLLPSTVEELQRIYLAKGALATTAIEGNTLTEEDVLRQMQGKLDLPPSQEYLAQEVENIISECNFILTAAESGKLPPLSLARIKALNRKVLGGLPPEEGVIPGQIRQGPVVVGRYKAPDAQECGDLLDQLCLWLGSKDFLAPKGLDIVLAIVKAIIAHLYLVWIHPFGNGNGRTARLMEFQILILSGVPAPAAHLLSNHYNQTRSEYYKQLERASRSGGDVLPFIVYAVDGFRDGLKKQLEYIHDQQSEVVWRDYVHLQFAEDHSETGKRRRDLVLDLSSISSPISAQKIKDISPRLAAAYARKTPKTLSRDLNELLKMRLIAKSKEGFQVRKDVLTFLRARRANTGSKQEKDESLKR